VVNRESCVWSGIGEIDEAANETMEGGGIFIIKNGVVVDRMSS